MVASTDRHATNSKNTDSNIIRTSLCLQSTLGDVWISHYCDGITGAMASQIAHGVSNRQPHDCLLNRSFRQIKKKHYSSASLAFVRGIHRWPVNSPHKWPVTRKNVSIWWRHHDSVCQKICVMEHMKALHLRVEIAGKLIKLTKETNILPVNSWIWLKNPTDAEHNQ